MRCQNCRKRATLYICLVLDSRDETTEHDGYYCDDHAAEIPEWPGGKWNGLEIIERTEAPL